MGGQSHVCCESHDVPLITCCDKEARCYQKLGDYCYGKRAYMCCPSLDCKTWVCKVCYDSYDDDDNEVHHVEVMNDVVVEEYMNGDSDDESYE